ncbi:MAG: CHAT domain-containing protein [Rubrivivax sp.]|nr:CHAT domain-containing protein [Rubrivivax sp.]
MNMRFLAWMCAAWVLTAAPTPQACAQEFATEDMEAGAATRAEIEQQADRLIGNHGTERIVQLHKRADARARLGRYVAAVADLREALRLGPPAELRVDAWGARWRIDHDLVTALWHSGELLAALEHHKGRAFPTGRAAAAHWNAATLQLGLGLLDEAEQSIRAARQSLQELRHSARLRAQLGGEARSPAVEALWASIVDGQEAHLLEMRGQLREAEGSRRLALTRARETVERSLALPPGDPVRVQYAPSRKAQAQRNLAANLVAQGRMAEAEVLLRDTLNQLQPLAAAGTRDRGAALLVLGKMRLQQGRLADAEPLLRATLAAAEAAELAPQAPWLADLRAQLGTLLVLRGRDAEAVQLFERRGAPLSAGGAHIEWAHALARSGRYEAAHSMFAQIIEAERSRPYADALLLAQTRGLRAAARRAEAQQTGGAAAEDERAALLREFAAVMPVLLAQAESAARNEAEDFVNRWRMKVIAEAYLAQLAACADGCGVTGPDIAAEGFRVAESVRESQVQRAMAAGLARARLPDAQLQALARDEQALQVRGRALREVLQRLLLAAPEQRLNKIAGDLQRELARMDDERRAIQAEIARRFPAYAELAKPSPASLPATQLLLAPGEALLATYVSDERTYLWTVTRMAVAFRAVARGRDDLAAAVRGLRRQLEFGEAAPPRFDATVAHALYRDLLAPDAGLWSHATLLHVVPHGELSQLPFSLLVRRIGAQPRWLIEDIAVAQLPTVNALHSLRRGPPAVEARRAFVGFGDPVFSAPAPAAASAMAEAPQSVRRLVARKRDDGAEAMALLQSLGRSGGGGAGERSGAAADALPQATLAGMFSTMPALPDTAQELRDIAGVMKADAARDLHLGLAASERSVKSLDLSDYKVVAFATHGLMAGDVDGLDQPALALSNPQLTREDDDGLLTMGEVLGLKLNADWVVLSACNTASSDGSAGEALSGLGRAFFFAGARSLLVSNWPVETDSARRLTTGVFQAQAVDATVGRAEALRRAIRALQKQPRYAHPIFWAPFVLVGDGAGR